MNALLLLLCLAQDDAGRLAVQHEGRVKPLDTFARQLMQFLAEKERFRGPTDDPVANVLRMIADPRGARGLRIIKITHPELRPDPARSYYSLDDLDPIREKLIEEARLIDEEEATSRQRAVLKVLNQVMTLESLCAGRLLAIVPIPFGENRSWLTPEDVRAWLAGRGGGERGNAIEAWVGGDPGRRAALGAVLEAYDAADWAVLAARLRAVNPSLYPTDEKLAVEIRYNRARPFHWASGVYFVAALLFLMSLVFGSRKVWASAMIVHLGALGLTGYGYALRWIIAGRYPLSNHYESMIMCALGAALAVPALELFLKGKSYAGLAASLVASVLLVLANNVPAFAEQGFVAPLVPALQTVWMTLHVPIIMTGYALGMLLMVLGHIHLLRRLLGKVDVEGMIDRLMHRILQLTVLFLLLGIILGAVWAGEAWGRPWGWDMKETWALITLLCYLAMLHGRFLGALRAFGTAITSLVAFQVLVLTYYGVNFIFGKGLHTYGFGSGEVRPLAAFFAIEGIFMAVCVAARFRRPKTAESAAG